MIQETYENIQDVEEAAEQSKSKVLELLRTTIRPEFINRIDDIVMFSPLNMDDIAEIVQLQIQQIAARLSQQNIGLDSTPEAIEWLAKKGFDPQFGARPVKRALQTHVLNALSKELLSGNISSQKNILIDAFDDALVFRNATPKDV